MGERPMGLHVDMWDISRIDYDEINHYSRGTIQVYPTRGCPLSCTFCVVPTYYGGHGKSHRSHRTRNVENVCDEIEYLATKYVGRFSGCYFNEEAHNANVEWLVSFAETLPGTPFYQQAKSNGWVTTEDMSRFNGYRGQKMRI